METIILQQDHHHRRVIWSALSNKLACGICERVFVLNKLEFNLIVWPETCYVFSNKLTIKLEFNLIFLSETCYVFSNKLIKLVFLCSRPAFYTHQKA